MSQVTTVYLHPLARPASEERVACLMASLVGDLRRLAFIGVIVCCAATRAERSWT